MYGGFSRYALGCDHLHGSTVFHVRVDFSYDLILDCCYITKVEVTRHRASGAVEVLTKRTDASSGVHHQGHSVEPTHKPHLQDNRGAGVTKTMIALCLLFVITFLPWVIYPLVTKTDIALYTPPGLTVVTLFFMSERGYNTGRVSFLATPFLVLYLAT
ncbi:hypothetical protein BV898_17354 [Hypsibius exemplaris]|uniref:Uncharacterized protein n=1 Tax=Hypsibius exemplaris TaxID=2072580 RepID=A0A9X6RMH7_HYPEX|nr:hypothetical protein BV898_17354 [Hypsibius exemplaris]